MMDFGKWAYIGPGFTRTKARNSDPATSHEAAKNAATSRAAKQRLYMTAMLQERGGMTCKELSQATGIPYEDVKRRSSEIGAYRTGEVRGGCGVLAV